MRRLKWQRNHTTTTPKRIRSVASAARVDSRSGTRPGASHPTTHAGGTGADGGDLHRRAGHPRLQQRRARSARGAAAGGTIEENTLARDAHLIAVGPGSERTVRAADRRAVGAARRSRGGHRGAGERHGHAHVQPRGGHHHRRRRPPGSTAARRQQWKRHRDGTGQPGRAARLAGGRHAQLHHGQLGGRADRLRLRRGRSTGRPLAATPRRYTVTAADVGKTATCVVTAGNAQGSTAAPPSNEVTIADPATAGGQSRSKR